MPMRIPRASSAPVCTVARSSRSEIGPAYPSGRVAGTVEVQAVSELVLLGAEIAFVVGVRRNDERDLVRHLEAVAAQAVVLPRVVGEHHHPLDPEVRQDLGADPIVALVDRQAEAEIRLDGVEAAILERVRTELVHEADAAALLAKIDEHTFPGVGDHRHRLVQLRLAVASLRSEDITGQALAVDSDEHGLA